MKKVIILMVVFSFLLGACLPAFLQPQATATASPLPISVDDLKGTATALAQSVLQPEASPTLLPSSTPIVSTETNTPIPTETTVPTETENPILLTLTATLNALPAAVEITATPGTPIATSVSTLGTAIPLHAGTMPPALPYGEITLINQSKAQVYISLRCVTKDGYVTIIEYPVRNTIKTNAPAGKYTYVVWVGGRQILGDFTLSKSQSLTIKILKDKVLVKQ